MDKMIKSEGTVIDGGDGAEMLCMLLPAPIRNLIHTIKRIGYE